MTGSRLGVLAVMDGTVLTGPARQLLASAQRCTDVLITLVIFQRPKGPTPLVRAARRLNVPTVVVRDRFPGDPRTTLALARLAAKPGTRILQTHGYKANVLAALIAPRARRPWVAFLHGETWENSKVRVYFALERLAIRCADRIVVVSHQMARTLEARGIPGSKIRVVHNACLVETPEHEAAGDVTPSPIVGVVGRLSPEKGVDIALRVQHLVARRRQGARLWIIGEGQGRASLEKDAQRLGIASSVEWLGYREDLRVFYRRMAVLLIPSRSEGLPNVALEAMAHGVPVVATTVGGVPEVVADGRTGFLAPSGDVEALASRVLQLLDDPPLRERLGHAGRTEAMSRFSPEARGRALARIYEEVVA